MPAEGRTGVCLSGGGVRSAAYNLGALQSLQEAGRLERVDYLAAVSGGSYIAAAHTMVARSEASLRPQDLDDGEDARVRASLEAVPPFAPGSPEEDYLRKRSSYLAPGPAGKLGVLYRVLIGLLVNLGVLVLVLVPTGVALGLLYRPMPGADGAGAPAWAWPVVAAPVAVLLVIGLVQAVTQVRDAWSRAADAWSLRLLGLAALLAVLLLALPALLGSTGVAPGAGVVAAPSRDGSWWTPAGVSAGSALTVLVAVLTNLAARVTEVDDAIKPARTLVKAWRGLSTAVRRVLLLLAAYVAGPLLVLTGLAVTTSLTYQSDPAQTRWAVVGALACVVVAALVLTAGDLTSWSMHPFYRRRLATAFALRRRYPAGAAEPVAAERPYDVLVRLSDMAPSRAGGGVGGGPTLVVCAAANISTYGATGEGRAVTSFTFDPHVIGGPLVGYVPTPEWEEKHRTKPSKRSAAVTLLAAVAMSGAALSPSMGKMSRGHLRFLLTLANVRLGVWVPNPLRSSAETADPEDGVSLRRLLPRRPRATQLWREYVGRNSLHGRYLYVTDGGHYENLGLVELLRRGCTTIYCFDASGGSPTGLSTLGDAVALARSELGVEITVDVEPLFPREGDGVPAAEHGLAPQDCVEGSYTYRHPETGVEVTGRLFYARTVVTRAAPWDVLAFRRRDPRFPNHSTAGQLYSDERFEAYRALGRLAGRHAVALEHGSATPASVDTVDMVAAGTSDAVDAAVPAGAVEDGAVRDGAGGSGAAREADVPPTKYRHARRPLRLRPWGTVVAAAGRRWAGEVVRPDRSVHDAPRCRG
ncbi:patatin-like phospholipase family protein [Pseudokineococcus basanitobsidens]|uniref:Patatin-like phospholipase family protein n=1 Tax=Pseudokineococcus basanitobsidens TaxID=1926649 RepID=A0ABU8RF81_9ACTN